MPGVYISYPFCAQKCTYCNFASGVFPRELERDYLDCSLRGNRARRIGPGSRRPSIWAAARPAAWSLRDLERILAAIPGGPGAKRPSKPRPAASLPNERAAWVAAGINRVSLGVQSFVQRELARTGRKHTAEIVAGEIGMLREAPASTISISI